MFGCVIIMLIGTALLAGEYAYNSYEEPTPIEQPISLEEVYDENYLDTLNESTIPHYDAEELLCDLADTTYKVKEHEKIINNMRDKNIIMTGEIDSIRYNYIDGCYIVFRQNRNDSFTDGWGIITCYFYDKAEKSKVLGMKPGKTVSIYGHTEHAFLTGPSMTNCYIVD